MDKDDISMVSKAVVCDKKNRILILLPAKKRKWHLPGGHLKQHETFLNGMQRELFEETGLKPVLAKIIYSSVNFALFFVKPHCTNVKLSSEHIQYRWVDFEKGDINKLALTKETLRDINEYRRTKLYTPTKKASPRNDKKAPSDESGVA